MARLTAKHYAKCKDFGEIYEILSQISSKTKKGAGKFDDLLRDHKQRCKKEPTMLRKYLLDDGKLYYSENGREAMCIPDGIDESGDSFRWTIFNIIHSSPLGGHRGVGKTYEAMRRRFYWPGTRYGKRWYLIHWKGYDEVTQSTWEKREALTTSAKKILADYEKKHPILKGELARKKRRKKT